MDLVSVSIGEMVGMMALSLLDGHFWKRIPLDLLDCEPVGGRVVIERIG